MQNDKIRKLNLVSFPKERPLGIVLALIWIHVHNDTSKVGHKTNISFNAFFFYKCGSVYICHPNVHIAVNMYELISISFKVVFC